MELPHNKNPYLYRKRSHLLFLSENSTQIELWAWKEVSQNDLSPEQGLANIFCKEPDTEYLGL